MPRNSSGTYTLAADPVANNEVLDPDNENATRNDIAQELTYSLDRFGRGGMFSTCQLKVDDGNSGLPGLSFVLDPLLGIYRVGTGMLGITRNGTPIATFKAGEMELPGTTNLKGVTFAFSGGGTVGGNLSVTGTSSFTGTMSAGSVAATGAVSGASSTSTGTTTAATFAATAGGLGLKLSPGAADCCYAEFYARTASPGTRTAYLGFPAAAATEFNIQNDAGHIRITPASGSAVKTASGSLVMDTTGSAAFDASSSSGFTIQGPAGGQVAVNAAGAISITPGLGQLVTFGVPLRTTSTAFTTGTNFAPTGTPSAYKGATGAVSLFACYTAGATNKQITTLPSGYAPASAMVVNLVAQASGGVISAQATISTGGVVTLVNAPTNGDKFYLDGLTFMAT